jgi:hypothetical protein
MNTTHKLICTKSYILSLKYGVVLNRVETTLWIWIFLFGVGECVLFYEIECSLSEIYMDVLHFAFIQYSRKCYFNS